MAMQTQTVNSKKWERKCVCKLTLIVNFLSARGDFCPGVGGGVGVGGGGVLSSHFFFIHRLGPSIYCLPQKYPNSVLPWP